MFRVFTRRCYSSFASLGLSDGMVARLAQNRMTTPTEIQRLSIPSIKSNKDVIVAAETGSGKTIAYLTPLLDDIEERIEAVEDKKTLSMPRIIILTPSRDLCNQVTKVCSSLVSDNIRIKSAYGMQEFPVHSDPITHILITTPGCLRMNLNMTPEICDMVHTMVLDEADMLLNGAYLDDTREIIETTRWVARNSYNSLIQKKQFVLAGATFPESGKKSVAAFIKHNFKAAERIESNEFHKYKSNISIEWMKVWGDEVMKFQILIKRLYKWYNDHENDTKPSRALIFVNSVKKTKILMELFEELDVPFLRPLSYSKTSQKHEREEILEHFLSPVNTTDNAPNLLVCTDLACRGLDFKGVTLVVQYDFALNVVNHFHRMGRTGRATLDGEDADMAEVFNMYEDGDADLANMLKRANDDPSIVEHTFSRRRGFRKRIKGQKKRKEYYDNKDKEEGEEY